MPVGAYTFKAVGGASAYEFTVNVTAVTETALKNITIQRGCNAVIYLGNVQVASVSLNGAQLTAEQYGIDNLMLTVDADLLTLDTNEIVINGDKKITVTLVD